jgi:hypothetical protein
MGEIPERLQELIREVEAARGDGEAGSKPRPRARPAGKPGGKPGPAASSLGTPAVLVLLTCGLLGGWLGYSIGSQRAWLAWSQRQPAERQRLLKEGWREDGSGVFYRWCRGDCHAPRLYGGGVIQEFQVSCLERPCGDLVMRFEVLNHRGEPIATIPLQEAEVHWGEERRFYVESPLPEAASIRLVEFMARARV